MNSQRIQLPHSLRPHTTGISHLPSMCILRIAREGPRNPRNCILVRGRGVWRASFDKVSVDGRPRRLIKTKTEARKHKRDGRTHPVHPYPVLPCLCMWGEVSPGRFRSADGAYPSNSLTLAEMARPSACPARRLVAVPITLPMSLALVAPTSAMMAFRAASSSASLICFGR